MSTFAACFVFSFFAAYFVLFALVDFFSFWQAVGSEFLWSI
jgi:hypothetical protein